MFSLNFDGNRVGAFGCNVAVVRLRGLCLNSGAVGFSFEVKIDCKAVIFASLKLGGWLVVSW